MRRSGLLGIAVAGIIVAVGCSRTDAPKSSSEKPASGTAAVGTAGTADNAKSDADYVHDIAIMNMAEVELSRMALAKATSPDIKLFAQRIIDEHAAAENKLKGVISGQPIEWPAQVDDKRRETAGDLAKKQGADFDHDYLEAMVHGHQDLAAKLESRIDVQSLSDWNTAAAGRTQNQALPDPKTALSDIALRPAKSDNPITMKINQWAAETYPMAQKHLDTARTLENAAKKRTTD
jgi:putative membrane protein